MKRIGMDALRSKMLNAEWSADAASDETERDHYLELAQIYSEEIERRKRAKKSKN